MPRFIPLLLLALGLLASPASAQDPASQEPHVRAAVLDYVDALYQADPSLIVRSVSPDLHKYGVSFTADGSVRWSSMTYQQLLGLAERYNAAGVDMADQPREVELLSVESRIASASLRARWGVDYLLLTLDEDGKWRIRQVLWQGRPPTPSE